MSTLSWSSIETHSPQLAAVEEREAVSYLDRAEKFRVISGDTRNLAAARMAGLKELIKEAHAAFDPIVEKTNAAHKEACDQRRRVIEPLDSAYCVMADKVGTWDLAEERRKNEEDRAQREAARRQAELEREAEIKAAENAGATAEEVAAICEMPVVPVPLVFAPRAAKSRVSTRANLKGKVANMAAFVAHVAKNPQLINLLEVNQGNLDRLVKATGAAAKIPGVEVYNAAIVTTRTGRKAAQ